MQLKRQKRGNQMPNYNETKKLVDSFKELQEGWHYGEGVRISSELISNAHLLLCESDKLGFNRFNAFPGSDGAIQITIYDGPNYYAFTFEPDGSVSVLHEQSRKEVFTQENLSLEEALLNLEEFAFELCDTSELFTPSTLTVKASASMILPLETQVRHLLGSQQMEFQFLKWNALSKEAGQFATTSEHSIHLRLAETLLSTGSYRQIQSLPIASGSKRTVQPEISAITT